MTDKMREDFEAWYRKHTTWYPPNLWECWQAATAESTAKIAQMQARIDELVEALIPAKEKLQIYREHSTGEYQGGMEYTQLINLIDEALAKVKDVK